MHPDADFVEDLDQFGFFLMHARFPDNGQVGPMNGIISSPTYPQIPFFGSTSSSRLSFFYDSPFSGEKICCAGVMEEGIFRGTWTSDYYSGPFALTGNLGVLDVRNKFLKEFKELNAKMKGTPSSYLL